MAIEQGKSNQPFKILPSIATAILLFEEQRDEAPNAVWRGECRHHLATLARLREIAPQIEALLRGQEAAP